MGEPEGVARMPMVRYFLRMSRPKKMAALSGLVALVVSLGSAGTAQAANGSSDLKPGEARMGWSEQVRSGSLSKTTMAEAITTSSTLTPTSVAKGSQVRQVNATLLNIRSGPSTSYSVVKQVPKGTLFVGTPYNQQWWKITSGPLAGNYTYVPYLTYVDAAAGTAPGVDVSNWSGTVDWNYFKDRGIVYSFAKGTEGTYYKDASYPRQTTGAKEKGILTGAYHFANPSQSSGTAQADYFVNYVGQWTPGNLPGVLDMEWNPYSGNDCYDMTQTQMATWVSDFQERYKARNGVYPIIYTSASWWNLCVGSGTTSKSVANKSLLWTARYGTSTPGTLPTVWDKWAIWQTGVVSEPFDYDTDIFNGSAAQVRVLAQDGFLTTR